MTPRIAVIGAGFYGLMIALEAKRLRPRADIVVFESEPSAMTRASRVNQARVHAGYHYPRSLQTAYRSQLNYRAFIERFPDAIDSSFRHIYGVAAEGSKTNFQQFVRFCAEIGAKAEPIASGDSPIAPTDLLAGLVDTDEAAFDFSVIRKSLLTECKNAGISIIFNTRVSNVVQGQPLELTTDSGDSFVFDFVFNTTYAGVGQFGESWLPQGASVKLELTEMCLVKVPESFANIGVTIMDGPFFSLMPYPSTDLHSFSHVRFTPIESTLDLVQGVRNPSELKYSMFNRMKLDAQRYFPELSNLEYVTSIVDVKAVLTGNEIDDGRPILYYENPEIARCLSVLGGKLDNIFDVFHDLEKTLVS